MGEPQRTSREYCLLLVPPTTVWKRQSYLRALPIVIATKNKKDVIFFSDKM